MGMVDMVEMHLLVQDNDTKLTTPFNQVFETGGATIKRNTPVSPNSAGPPNG